MVTGMLPQINFRAEVGRIERNEAPAFMGLPDVRRNASFIRPTRKPSRHEILTGFRRYQKRLFVIASATPERSKGLSASQ